MSYNCPTANTIPVSLNMGFQMPSWFNIFSLELNGPEDEEGIKAAATEVHGMINVNILKFHSRRERMIMTCIFFFMSNRMRSKPAFQLNASFLVVFRRAVHSLSTRHWHFHSGLAASLDSLAGCHCTHHFQLPKWRLIQHRCCCVMAIVIQLLATSLASWVIICWKTTSHRYSSRRNDNIIDFVELWLILTFISLDSCSYQGLAHQSSPEEISDIKDFINQQIPSP